MNKNYLITILLITGISLTAFTMGYTFHSIITETKTPGNVSKDYTDVGGNIDIEYYLEVSEDSIWIENTISHRVYGGTYTQLDSLVTIDNQ